MARYDTYRHDYDVLERDKLEFVKNYVIADSISRLDPKIDANAYRLYAAAYNKEYKTLSREDLSLAATESKDAILMFYIERLKDILRSIIITTYLHHYGDGKTTTFRVRRDVLDMIQNFINQTENIEDGDYDDTQLRMMETVRANVLHDGTLHGEWNWMPEVKRSFGYAPGPLIRALLNRTLDRIDRYQPNLMRLADASVYDGWKDFIGNIMLSVKTFVWLGHTHEASNEPANGLELFDRHCEPTEAGFKQIDEKTFPYSGLPFAQAICLDIVNNREDLELDQFNLNRVSDAYRYLYMTALYKQTAEDEEWSKLNTFPKEAEDVKYYLAML